MTPFHRRLKAAHRLGKGALAAVALALASASQAALIDLASSPLVVSNLNSVKPNILFILDDSGSMDWDYAPDYVGENNSSGQNCRATGAGLDAATYSGTFTASCCTNPVDSQTCMDISRGTTFGTQRGHPPFMAAPFNGMAYNPATRYLPPANANGTERPSMTSAETTGWTLVPYDQFGVQSTTKVNLISGFPDTAWCSTTDNTDCVRNSNYVLPGRIGSTDYTVFSAVVATGTGRVATGAPDAATLQSSTFGPYYYQIIPGEFCDGPNLRNCQQGQSATFNVPAPVRWCNSDANARAGTPAAGSCQATRTSTYSHVRYPTKFAIAGTLAVPAKTNSITLSLSCSSGTVGIGSLVVNGVDLFRGTATGLTNSASTLAGAVRTRVNAGTAVTGYSATGSSTNFTLNAPASAGNLTVSATLTRQGGSATTCTYSLSQTPTFSGYAAPTVGTFGGSFERVDIVPSRTTYPKANTRTDCAATTSCSYDEEMTNFANWYAYYHTRMQSMKSSVSRAFSAVGDNRRVGYATLNRNVSGDWVNVNTFSGTHKTNWFNQMVKANPGSSTPLRTRLAEAGRYFGGRLSGSMVEPMQYSCQKNYTLLSTDGYWNESGTPVQLDGSTAIGDQDASLTGAERDGVPVANTLADVASYYFRTDSRTTTNCTGALSLDVCGTSTDPNVPSEKQVMRTFTLGLGIDGFMQFTQDYLSATSGDFWAVKTGQTPNTAAGICSWQTSGNCTWPPPSNNTQTNVDDLWHAAVNGGGTYFSARDPITLYTGLYNALSAIDVVESSTAAATTSNPNITAGDNQIFVSSFRSGEWTGEVQGKRIDVTTGDVLTSTAQDWSASALLDANTSRSIYVFAASETTKLKPFNWTSLTSSEKAWFQTSHITATGRALSQFCGIGAYCLSAALQTAAAGEQLVNFLAGQRTNEGALADATKAFRQRASLLGDVVNSEAVFVGAPSLAFNDTGYAAYRSAQAARGKMVYIGANDGMLHALNAETGQEAWAYIPTAVLPNLYRLADKEYSSKHQYYVDATATVQDAYLGSQWRTVLVGGLGAGGRAYYALDVTDPTAPKALWEFTNNNLGFTFGKAEIGKLEDGTWVAIVASGYNNVSPGDGKGYLFVLRLADGALLRTIDTGQGTTSDPAGLAHIQAWYDNGESDATIRRVYGGDNLGNVWRFDVNNNVGAAGYDAQRLATLRSATGTVQPVTSRPELGQVGSYVMVFVGTGRYLGASDLPDTSPQSIYGIKDRMNNLDFGNPRDTANAFVRQTLSVGACPANATTCTAAESVRLVTNPLPVNLASNGGWMVDLPVASERVNTDPILALGTLIVTSNIITSGDVCKVGGSSWINFIDYATGASVVTAQGVAGVFLSNGIGSRSTVGLLPSGQLRSYTTVSNRPRGPEINSPPYNASSGGTRRHSWRDLGGN